MVVMCGNSEYDWNTMPMSRLFTGMPATSSPSIRMRPEVICSRPDSERSTVVLPQPEGPSRATNSPGSMVRFTPVRARLLP